MNGNEDTLGRLRLADPAPTADPDEIVLLRSMIDEAIAAHSNPSQKMPERSPVARRSWRPVVVVAAALLVSLAVFVPVMLFGGGDHVDVGATTIASPTIATSTSAGPVVPVNPVGFRWTRAETPGWAGAYLWFDGVVAGGPGLIAVGSPDWPEPTFIWTSTDGLEWSPATTADAAGSGWAFDVIAGGPGYVAVGSSVWTSTDGVEWTRIDGGIIGELRAVTVGGPGLVAVGTVSDGPATVWTSVDGLQWSQVMPEGPLFGHTNTEMLDVVAGGPGLVAVGHSGGVGAVWTSSDGLEWERVPHDQSVFGNGSEGTELASIASDGSLLIAVGRITDDGTMGVWKSLDGVTWTKVALDALVLNESHELTTITYTGAGFVAGGDGGNGDAGAWFSVDGSMWVRVDTGDALAGPGYQRISDITVFENHLVAVGWELEGARSSEVVWIAQSSQE